MKKAIVAAAGAVLLMSGQAMAADGKAVFDKACQACHRMGIAGAPKMGDKKAWADRVTQDMAVLYEHSLKGFKGKTGVMPPKGGFMALSDEEVTAAVDYMVSQSK